MAEGTTLLDLLNQAVTQLDGLIRGRKVDMTVLLAAGAKLLTRSFDAKGEDKADKTGLVAQSIKLHNMLRSPRFSQADSNRAFGVMRAAAANLISLEGTNQNLVSILRTHAKSAAELGRLPDMSEHAIRILTNLEQRWADGSAVPCLGEHVLQPAESKECDKIIVDALLLKADLLSAAGRSGDAIDTLEGSTLDALTKSSPHVLVHLATKAFKYGQLVMMKRDGGTADRSTKASAASKCYKAALDLLARRGDPGGGQVAHDAAKLKSKCLIQHALALHLGDRHNEALVCLEAVVSPELRQDTQDLRFGALLAAGRTADLHRCIKDLIRTTAGGKEDGGTRLSSGPDCERILSWLRRAAVATQFDPQTMQHYRELQTNWKDDQRYLDVRFQLLSGLLAQGQCPAPAAGVASSLTTRGLELCDDILKEHAARERLLSQPRLATLELALMHGLNGAHQMGDMNSAVAHAERFVRALDFSASASSPTSSARRAGALVMQADALLSLRRHADAAQVAERAFAARPSSDAFAISFSCAVLDKDPLGKGRAVLQILESRASHLQPLSSILDALEQSVAIVGTTRDSSRTHDSGATAGGMDYETSLVALELVMLSAYVRAFERLAVSSPTSPPPAESDSRPSYAAYLLRAYALIIRVPAVGPTLLSAGPFELQSSSPNNLPEEFVDLTVQSTLTGARFLLGDTKMSQLGTTTEIRLLSAACWNLAQHLRERGYREHTKSDGQQINTKLLMVSHALQEAAELAEGTDMGTSFDGAQGGVECGEPRKRLRDGVNRVGILTMAASDVVARELLSTAVTQDPNETPAPLKRARLSEALEWIVKAQTTALGLMSTATGIKNDANEEDQDAPQQLETLGSMNATLSLLRLMSGLHGIHAPPASSTTDADKAPLTDEEVLLSTVEECKVAMSAVPAESLRAAASASKRHGYAAVAHRLLRIAIEDQELKCAGIAPWSGNGEEALRARAGAAQLYCDLFHTSPDVEACLAVIDDILVLLEAAAQNHEASGFDIDAIETIASQCYNWGLQGLSLGSIDAGIKSERLIGKAQQLMPYCPSLREHEANITKAYHYALDRKEQEHQALIRHSQKLDL